MPTFNQLVRKGRQTSVKKSTAAAIAENRLKYENADFAEQCKTKERVIKKQMKKRGTL